MDIYGIPLWPNPILPKENGAICMDINPQWNIHVQEQDNNIYEIGSINIYYQVIIYVTRT
jgi:hypothetical protein